MQTGATAMNYYLGFWAIASRTSLSSPVQLLNNIAISHLAIPPTYRGSKIFWKMSSEPLAACAYTDVQY